MRQSSSVIARTLERNEPPKRYLHAHLSVTSRLLRGLAITLIAVQSKAAVRMERRS